jgi:hypothetical protein
MQLAVTVASPSNVPAAAELAVYLTLWMTPLAAVLSMHCPKVIGYIVFEEAVPTLNVESTKAQHWLVEDLH